jgi:hypothetical protein
MKRQHTIPRDFLHEVDPDPNGVESAETAARRAGIS